MSEVTFRVIENYEPVVDYDEFKKDFLNPLTRSSDLKEKYGLSKTRWRDYKNRVCDECNIARKPIAKYHSQIIRKAFPNLAPPKGMEYIQRKQGGYIVVKTFDRHCYYFGRYKSLECAKKVRDKLVMCDWNLTVGEELKEKYGLKRGWFKPAKIKALQYYDEFEQLYLFSDMPVVDIKKKMNLTSSMYKYLTDEIHHRHGNHSRRWFKKHYDSEV